MSNKALAGMTVLVIGIVGLLERCVTLAADSSLKACTTITVAALQAQYGPVNFHRDDLGGVWLDRDGREIGYSDNEDEAICLTV